MAEYFGYVKRDPTSQVDWNSISRGITGELGRIYADREKQKADLDKMNQELARTANELEMTDNDYVNRLIVEGADQYKQLALMNNKLLKRGLLNPKDYTLVLENMKSGVAGLSDSISKFGPAYKESMERLAKGEMGILEQSEKENLFKYGNLKDKVLYINPADGLTYIAEKDADGNIITDPSKMMNVSVMGKKLGEKRQKLDVKTEISKGAKLMANIEKSIRKGGVLTKADARQNKAYQESKEKFISSLMSDENVVSILGDYMGTHEITRDKNDKDPNKIYIDPNGKIQLTEDQRKAAREALDNEFEAQIESVEEPMPVFSPNQTGENKGKSDASYVSNLAKLYYGSPADVESALSYLSGTRDDIVKVNRNDREVVVTRKDGVVTIPFYDSAGNLLTQRQFVERAINQLTPGVSDINKAYSQSGIDDTRGFNSAGTGSFEVRKPVNNLSKTPVVYEGAGTTADAAITSIGAGADKASELNVLFQDVDPNLSFEGVDSGWFGTDKIRIMYNGQLVEEINFDGKEDIPKFIETINRVRMSKGGQSAQPSNQSGSVDYSNL